MKKRKKVFWLIKGLGKGGAEQLLTLSLPYLDRDSYDYEVGYFLPWKTDLVPAFEEAGIPVFCLNNKSPLDLGISLRLAKLLRSRNVDVLHVHSPYPAVLGRVVSRFAGISAVVYTAHNLMESFHPVTRAFLQVTSPLDRASIAVSKAVHHSFVEGRLLQPRHMQVIYNSVDLSIMNGNGTSAASVRESLGIPADHLVVGNVAHLRSQKGHGYLLEAARQVIDQCPNTTFVIVGREKEEGYQASLEAQASRLGIRDRVVFTGFLEDPLPVVSAFDVFVQSSLFEGLPVAMLEAMALGKTPIVTAVGGVPEVIEDGKNGFLVEPRNSSALAEKVVALLRDGETRSLISRRARATIEERFTAQRMVKETEQVYSKALQSRS